MAHWEKRGSKGDQPYAGEAVGRVLDQRFLVENDLTDHSIGSGFFSFLVKDLKNFCQTAVLKITAVSANNAGRPGPSFLEVCGTLAQLRHVNLETIIEKGRLSDGRIYALAEYQPGTALNNLIAGGKRLSLERAAGILGQVAYGLAAAHARRIIHCDLRPSNIIVSGHETEENVRVINFGSAWPVDIRGERLGNLTRESESLYYAAPELLVRLGHRSTASDIYSFSVLAYRLIAGTVPFRGTDRRSLLDIINSGAAASPGERRTDLTEEAAQMILAGLRFEPVWRPRDIGEFGERLARAICPPKDLPVIEVSALPEVGNLRIAENITETKNAPQPDSKTDFVPLFARTPKTRPVSDRAVVWALIVLLMAGALSIPIGQNLLTDRNKATAAAPMVERPPENKLRREIRYKLESGRNKAASLAQNLAGGGQFTFTSDSAGDAYVFAEISGDDGFPNYRLLFPSQSKEARGIEAGKTEIAVVPAYQQPIKALWIVWTAVKNVDLEAICSYAAQNPELNESDVRKLRHFLERNKNLRVEVNQDQSSGQTVLSGSGDKVVYRITISES